MPIEVTEYAPAVAKKAELRHLLLGNGFSRALNSELFDFRNLFEKAGFQQNFITFVQNDGNPTEGLGTYPDFEKTLKSLRDTELTIRHLGQSAPQELINLQEEIKNGIVRAVHNVHEVKDQHGKFQRYVTSFSSGEVLSCAKFLNSFHDRSSLIFTLNYDLLLYRVLMEIKSPNSSLEEAGLLTAFQEAGISELRQWGDGFIRVDGAPEGRWESWANVGPRLCYLHGALHLLTPGDQTVKLICDEDNLVDIVGTAITNGATPLVVCEGTTNRKRGKIFASNYLRDCHSRLTTISGQLFILGCSIADNDQHIWSALDKNPAINKIYIGFFGATELNNIKQAVSRHFLSKVKLKAVSVFDASTINIWQ